MSKSISALQLGIVWLRMTGLMDEVAQTFVRTSFSVVVRENWDLACSLLGRLETKGRQLFVNSGLTDAQCHVRVSAAIRYVGQGYEVEVRVTSDNHLRNVGHPCK